MCDGNLRKIGISGNPGIRRSQIQADRGCRVELKHQFWIDDHAAAARVEIMAHALAGSPVIGREWFDISSGAACEAVVEAITRIGAKTTSGHKPPVAEAQKSAMRRYREKRIAAGFKACSFLMSEKAKESLVRHAKVHGSQERAMEALIDKEYERMIAAREAGAAYP